MSLEWRYRVRFDARASAREYISPDVRMDLGWGCEDFRVPIESIELHLPIPFYVLMRGMHQYNLCAEALEAMSLSLLRPRALALLLFGRAFEDRILFWRVGGGRVTHDEWSGGALSGWKAGIPDPAPVSILVPRSHS